MQKLAQYELIAKIASGGMAEIWVATDPSSKTTGREPICVVKKLLPQHQENEEFVQMFAEEARIADLLLHPNIVRAFGSGTENGVTFLAMEYLSGEDLRLVLKKLRTDGKTLPLEHALYIVAAAAAGLHHAHEARDAAGEPMEIIHRDVSPHNIFVGWDGEVKVVDFGIAKSRERRWETKHGTLKGKVPYMSPEQIKTRRLDRRTDVYSLGVVLYELVVGRKPYVLSAAGDFATMMAIARHDIRAPSEVAPNVDRDLEQIILRAIAYDPKQRFATLGTMRADILTYATAHDLELSASGLAKWIASVFGARVEAWRAAASAQGALAAHVVQVEEERAKDEVSELTPVDSDSTMSRPAPEALRAAPKSAASLIASTSAAIAAIVEVTGVTVVSLQGRIDEAFDGAALGGSLSGTVIFDLKGVERITSFGVREWLEMMRAIAENGDAEAWLCRCPEAVVTQMALIRNFPDAARLVSFEAPFLCDDCGFGYTRMLDCEGDANWFRGEAGLVLCPRCGGKCKLDDDPAFFAFAAAYADQPVPERLRMVITTVEQSDRSTVDVVDKMVSDDETRIRVLRDVDGSVRWNRIFDGIEGKLVLDFRSGNHVSAEGATALARALGALGPEVKQAEVVECPVSVVAALGSRVLADRPKVTSIALSGKCPACTAMRGGVASPIEIGNAIRSGISPFVPCRRCNAPLDLTGTIGLLENVFGVRPGSTAPPPLVAKVSSAPPTSLGSASVALAREAEPMTARRMGAPIAGAIALLLLGVASGALLVRSKTTIPGPMATSKLATDGPVVGIGADKVEITTRVVGSDPDAALAKARDQALSLLVEEIERGLPGNVVSAIRAAAPNERGLTDRFVRDVGAFANPERTETRLDGTALAAKYTLTRASFDRAIAYYGTTRTFGPRVLAPSFPTRRDGLIVVAGPEPLGALLVSIDGHPVFNLDGLPRARAKAIHEAVISVGASQTTVRLDPGAAGKQSD